MEKGRAFASSNSAKILSMVIYIVEFWTHQTETTGVPFNW